MTDILRPDNHDLWRRVQHLVGLRWHWEAIAIDVGVYDVKELVDWVLDYKEPKRPPMVRAAKPITWQGKPVLTVSNPKQMTAQFMAWKRTHDGAAKTLEGVQ